MIAAAREAQKEWRIGLHGPTDSLALSTNDSHQHPILSAGGDIRGTHSSSLYIKAIHF